MQKIAITGQIASGKSTLGRFLHQKGYAVADTDEIVHKLYEKSELKDALQSKFGLYPFASDGHIDRRKLAHLIYTDQTAKKDLETIVWPRVWEELILWFFYAQKRGRQTVFALVPQLFAAGWSGRFDQIWLVQAPDEQILERLQVRDRLPRALVQQRLTPINLTPDQQNQLTQTLINDATIDELLKTAETLITDLPV